MTNKVYNDIRRRKLIQKYEFKRRLLKFKHYSLLKKKDSLSTIELQFKLARLNPNSSITRARNRCLVTGRPKGVYKHFKLSRFILKEFITTKVINGLIKSSW